MEIPETKSHTDDVEICDLNTFNINNELFDNINTPSKIVTSSFEYFLQTAPENNLNSKIFSLWNFVKDLEDRPGIKLESEAVLNNYLGAVCF
jgi:hypothetical protein